MQILRAALMAANGEQPPCFGTGLQRNKRRVLEGNMRLAVIGVCIWFALCSVAHAEKRVALVIGNSAYQTVPALANPKHDAEDIAAALTRLGFGVTLQRDLTTTAFDSALDAFVTKSAGADIAFFFYAGHGLQIDKRGFMAPVDAKLETESGALRELVAIQEAVSKIEHAAKVTVIVLDACRNSPLQERLRRVMRTADRDAAPVKGLPVVSVTGSNTLVVYATVPGEVANDGTGRNSPFTASLLKHIEAPGVEIELMFKRVTKDVLDTTGGKQHPERLSRLQTELVLRGVPASAGSVMQKQAREGTIGGRSTGLAGDPELVNEFFRWLEKNKGRTSKGHQDELHDNLLASSNKNEQLDGGDAAKERQELFDQFTNWRKTVRQGAPLKVADVSGSFGTPIALSISAKGVEEKDAIVSIEGVPEGARLSAGIATGGGFWLLPVNRLEGLQLILPETAPEESELQVQLLRADGRTPVSETYSFVVRASIARLPVQEPGTRVQTPPKANAPKTMAVVIVNAVAGAPGDGTTSLTNAMKKQLTAKGLKIAGVDATGAYSVSGTVTIEEAEKGKQRVVIRWIVSDPSGKPLSDAVVQRNEVAQGALDGAWAEVANIIAVEAARPLADLLRKDLRSSAAHPRRS
jgi:hypothetical protein